MIMLQITMLSNGTKQSDRTQIPVNLSYPCVTLKQLLSLDVTPACMIFEKMSSS